MVLNVNEDQGTPAKRCRQLGIFLLDIVHAWIAYFENSATQHSVVYST